MKTRLLLNTRNLKHAFRFYSALGIEWLAGEDLATDVPEVEEVEMGLPSLWGNLGNVELMFYSNPSLGHVEGPATAFIISYEDDKQIYAALDRLEKAGVCKKHPEFDESITRKLIDPDGRIIELMGPGLLGL